MKSIPLTGVFTKYQPKTVHASKVRKILEKQLKEEKRKDRYNGSDLKQLGGGVAKRGI